MSRRLLIAGNWKMHLGPGEAGPFAQELKHALLPGMAVDVTVAPPYLGLPEAIACLKHTGVDVAGQNLHWERKGAYTGEITAEMLRAVGCSQVIIGHSERRQYFGETDRGVNRKLHAALRAGLVPIVCVGETLAQRDAGQASPVVESQLAGALAGLHADDLGKTIIAYEPVWAIGTGRTATDEQAQDMHATIRAWLASNYGAGLAGAVRILYGGSVKPTNAALLLSRLDIDGALVGGASLKVASFMGIIEAGASVART